MNRVLIAPSILSADFSRLGEEVEELERSGADLIHIDVMDGMFVPNITVGPCVISSIRKRTKLPLDVHLMIVDPGRYIDAFIDAGSDFLTIHYEADVHIHRTLEEIKKKGVKCGISINPGTPVHVLQEVIDLVDLVLIMTVNPGFGGQKIIPSTVKKVEKLAKMLPDNPPLVEVDGGINRNTIGLFKGKKVDIFVSGSGVFSEGNYKEAIEGMRRVVCIP